MYYYCCDLGIGDGVFEIIIGEGRPGTDETAIGLFISLNVHY